MEPVFFQYKYDKIFFQNYIFKKKILKYNRYIKFSKKMNIKLFTIGIVILKLFLISQTWVEASPPSVQCYRDADCSFFESKDEGSDIMACNSGRQCAPTGKKKVKTCKK